MLRSKKHSPQQTDTESILMSIPDERMDEFVKELQMTAPPQIPKSTAVESLPETSESS